MNRTLTAVLPVAMGAALAGFAVTARADSDQGFYAGAGVGSFNVKVDNIQQLDEAIKSINESDTSWKGFIGWRFNPFIALELAYIDFGQPAGNFQAAGSNGHYSLAFSGVAPYLVGTLPLGPIELFAKAGYYYYDVHAKANVENVTAPELDTKKSKTDVLYGGGIGITLFGHLATRLEYERLDSNQVKDADAVWLTGAWRF